MRVRFVAACFCALAFGSLVLGDDAADTAKPKTHTVAKGPLKVLIGLDGVFEPRESQGVLLKIDSWSDLTVREVVEPGAVVKAGDRLLALDSTKLDEAILDAENDLKTERLDLEESAADFRVLEQSTPQDLEQARHEQETAQDDYKFFTETKRQLEVRELDFTLKLYGNMLQYAKEELRQLEKMYKADDLMEETEEIILKQQRDQVEQLTFLIDIGSVQRQRTVDMELPRHERSLKEAAERATVSNDRSQRTLPLALEKARIRLEKSRETYRRNDEKLAKLKHDREALVINAPAAGVIYYGDCRHGDWSHAEMATRLKRGGSVSANEILMTIVTLRPLVVRATVPEKELTQVTAGMPAKIIATAWPRLRLPATVERVSLLPDPQGKFLVQLKLDDAAALPEALAPGMNCSLKITSRDTPDALTVPAKAVTADDDADRHYVHLQDGGKTVERDVTVGHRADERIEIVDGLQAGDVILLEKPED